MDAMNFEGFIRGAFSFALKKNMFRKSSDESLFLLRSGDPAGLAEADYFNRNKINEVKIATTYSMLIFRNYLVNISQEICDTDLMLIEDIINKIINSNNIMNIDKYITIFRNKIMDRYNLSDSNFW